MTSSGWSYSVRVIEMKLSWGLSMGVAVALLVAGTASSRPDAGGATLWPHGSAVVGYRSEAALRAALASHPARIVRSLPTLRAVEVRPRGNIVRFASDVAALPGIAYVEPLARRTAAVEPATVPSSEPGGAYEWQFSATHEDLVPVSVQRAAASVTVAVIDTGADLAAPDIAAKTPEAFNLATRTSSVTDTNGHGTFVASLAAGSVTNGDGIAGFGGDAKLMVIQASDTIGSFSDIDEADAIVYAVDHGAKIVNLSLGGSETSRTERNAIDYAVSHGALLVAAVGNEHDSGNRLEYPAALLQPPGSNGQGGVGLAVAASDLTGARADFSSTGSYLSLAAPGERVFAAVSAGSKTDAYPRVALPGSTAGLYGYSSGTSFAAPQVSGAAALVWAANPALAAHEVAQILKDTASGHGAWNDQLGFGVINVALAVAEATAVNPATTQVELTGQRTGRLVKLSWIGRNTSSYRLSVKEDRGPQRVLLSLTTKTSASYALNAGHTYSFTVAAVDDSGTTKATSSPYTVALMQSTATLTLTASRRSGRHPLPCELAAVLRAHQPTVSAAGRTLLLESWSGERWQSAGRASTSAAGGAVWTFKLGVGSYRVRARLLPNEELLGAVSPTVAITVS